MVSKLLARAHRAAFHQRCAVLQSTQVPKGSLCRATKSRIPAPFFPIVVIVAGGGGGGAKKQTCTADIYIQNECAHVGLPGGEVAVVVVTERD